MFKTQKVGSISAGPSFLPQKRPRSLFGEVAWAHFQNSGW